MTEALLDNLGVDTGVQHETGVSVTGVVEADAGQSKTLHHALPVLGEGVG
jgi:hypothetical protein